MNFLKFDVSAGSDDVIEVVLDKAANVRLLDSSNFYSYRNGRGHRYLGGYVTHSPYRIRVPQSGHWYLVVDLGGYAGTVRAGVRVLKN